MSYPKSADEVTQSEALLLPIAKAVNDYWEPIKTWTTIALTISQNGLALSAGSIALLVALLFYRAFLNLQEKISLLTLYNKLSTQKQRIIRAVVNAKKQGNPTTQGIAKELDKLTDSPTDLEQMELELQEAEKVGLIDRTLVNGEDKPAFAWRSLTPENSRFKSLPILSRFFK